ncbi:MAG: ribonuclease HI family protein [Candidatus Dojkabacteria bacterium]|nr:ribonuclease HI family protein [Candidatus Dojkabacteria bacterium]MDQ7021230.1 ribonuclease HI family protein [Candidatus Dojkabacteria bacterium]
MYSLFTDGGSRGNPGNAAIGGFIFDENKKNLDFFGRYIGEATNNVAEYMAVLEGIKLAKKHKIKELGCHLDSELVVKQLNGEYKVKHPDMFNLYEQVLDEKKSFEKIEFIHVKREFNRYADKMVNVILDTIAIK